MNEHPSALPRSLTTVRVEVNSVSMTMRVVVYFAKNPDEALTAEDASMKFNVPDGLVRKSLRGIVRKGILEYVPLLPGRERPKVYRAGPVLLRMIGLGDTTLAAVMQACGPLHVEQRDAGALTVDL